MVDFTRYKTLKQDFVRVSIDETDLARFARTIRDAVKDYEDEGAEGEMDIEVATADQEEVFRTDCPDFFESENMPATIRSVSVSYHQYEPSIACSISFSAGPEGSASLSAKGTDARVTGLFYDLVKRVRAKQVFGQRLTQVLDKSWFALLLGMLVAFAVYSAFDVLLSLLVAYSPEFKGSSTYSIIVSIGWGAVLLGLLMGGDPLVRLLKQCFPPVEFTGRLSDPQMIRRSRIVRTATTILIPIVLNVFSGMLIELITR